MTMLTPKETRLFLEGILMGIMILWLISSRIKYNRAKNNNKILENILEYDKKEKAKQQKSKVSSGGQKRKSRNKKSINV